MYAWLKEAISRDAVVITASRRLSRELHTVYSEQQHAAGRLAWQTPAIFYLGDWCQRQLGVSAEAGRVPLPIDRFSSTILWERCFRELNSQDLPALGGVIRQARDSWRVLTEWKVSLSTLRESARSPDQQLFAAAASAYRARLDNGNWVDRDELVQIVITLMNNGSGRVPKKMVLAGFDRLSPAVEGLSEALAANGCKLETAPEGELADDLSLLACDDQDAEMRTAGAWARDILQHSPGASVAIISPSLQSDAERAARQVREGLAPGWQYAGPRWRSAVNVSYGRSLSAYPAIAVALMLLRWIHRGLTTAEISLLLRSNCIATPGSAGRSRLELALRSLPDRRWTADNLLRARKGRDGNTDSPGWDQGLRASGALQAEMMNDASPAHWASRIDSFLGAWNWPGNKALPSDEFQLINRWRNLLNELAATTTVTPNIRFHEAVQRLAVCAAEVVFQPETDRGIVSLMGSLEAAGMRFDHVWVSGMHAGQWPTSGNPSPLLSRHLQRQYAMPDATPADSLKFARRVLRRLASSAESIVFSWPRQDGESELTASSLLEELDCREYSGPGDPGWHASAFCGEDKTVIVSNDPVPAVTGDETVRGGAYTVQRQTQEPFTAFVYGRLGVKIPQAIESGISAGLRGNITHSALCILFAECPTLPDIRRWDATNIAQRLGSAIDAAIANHLPHADSTLTRLLALERTRLFHLLRVFLAAEIERPDFQVVAVEKSVASDACGVALTFRIDRLDRLADGSLLIIDYKTGAPKNLLDKNGDLLDLQLVVYSNALNEETGGLALINLDSRAISYKGTGGSVAWDSARQDQWTERLAAWQATVQRALREIAAGDARINLQLSTADARSLRILRRDEEYERAH